MVTQHSTMHRDEQKFSDHEVSYGHEGAMIIRQGA